MYLRRHFNGRPPRHRDARSSVPQRRIDEAVARWWQERLEMGYPFEYAEEFRRHYDVKGNDGSWPRWVAVDALHTDYLMGQHRLSCSRLQFGKAIRRCAGHNVRPRRATVHDHRGYVLALQFRSFLKV